MTNTTLPKSELYAVLCHGSPKITSTEVDNDSTYHHVELWSELSFFELKTGFFSRLWAALSIVFLGGFDTRGVVRFSLSRDQAINLNDALIEEVYHPNGEYTGEQYNRL